MTTFFSRRFARNARRLSDRKKELLDEEIQKIAEDPSLGDEKKGDFLGVHIHRFKLKKTQHLLAYRTNTDSLEFIMMGCREDYYREIRRKGKV